MTTGSIDPIRQATLPVPIRDESSGQFVVFNLVIDTGFNGDVQLPNADIARLNLRQSGAINTTLADGSAVQSKSYNATARWLGDHKAVRVIDGADGILLIGAGLLWGSAMTIEWEFGGRVSVAPLRQPEPE